MGLGKTVEVLALILSHKWSISHTSGGSSNSLHFAREEDGVTFLKEGGVVDSSMEVDVVDSSMEVGVVNSSREGGVVAGGEKCECLCGKSDGGRSLDSWVQWRGVRSGSTGSARTTTRPRPNSSSALRVCWKR